MTETNKILEVTYGEFSCRLEGFEHPVETMKTVVAYFHELSGHEQFMDMHPQAPDVATLARLTEEQTGGAVEVENTAQGVSLRMRPRETMPADASETDADQEEIDAFVAALGDDTADDDTHAFDTAEAEEADAAGDDDDIADGAQDNAADDHEDNHGDAETAFDDETASEDGLDADGVSDETPEMLDTHASDAIATSVADRLERLRAAANRGPATATETYSEDISETDATPKIANPLAQRLAELAKRNSEVMEAEALAKMPEAHHSTPLELSSEDEVDTDDEIDTGTGEDIAENAAPFEDDEDDHDDDMAAKEEDTADVQSNGDIADVSKVEADDAEHLDIETSASDEVDLDAEEGDLDDDDAEDLSLSETDETLEVDTPDNPDDTTAEAAEEPKSKPASRPLLLTTRHTKVLDEPTSKSDEEDENDSFDLKAELAEIEREIAARPSNEFARHGLPRSVEDAMSRILNETNEQLNEPEGRRHRDAFAQLKAAVAATEASRQLGDFAKSRDISAQFRDDLGALDAEGKAKGEGLPLLKLVSPITDKEPTAASALSRDQPAAAPKPVDAASERLRAIATRVASRDASDETTFAAFAREQGAQELADLLEAAAAYIAYVEGDSDFSRPQVMKVVQSASDEEISREDGLRSFGRLLRQSRIIKLNNGRFQVAENTRFRPDTSRAARG